MVISSFQENGEHTPLSNFYRFPMSVDGREYATVEHYFQAMKTLDPVMHEGVRTRSTPGEAKRLGRKVELRPDWEAVKIPIMRWALMHKFEANNAMGEYLLGTGDELLVEGNTWGDRFWGAVGGSGHNWLGVLLMARRAELRGV